MQSIRLKIYLLFLGSYTALLVGVEKLPPLMPPSTSLSRSQSTPLSADADRKKKFSVEDRITMLYPKIYNPDDKRPLTQEQTAGHCSDIYTACLYQLGILPSIGITYTSDSIRFCGLQTALLNTIFQRMNYFYGISAIYSSSQELRRDLVASVTHDCPTQKYLLELTTQTHISKSYPPLAVTPPPSCVEAYQQCFAPHCTHKDFIQDTLHALGQGALCAAGLYASNTRSSCEATHNTLIGDAYNILETALLKRASCQGLVKPTADHHMSIIQAMLKSTAMEELIGNHFKEKIS